jgi:hypothetical protein
MRMLANQNEPITFATLTKTQILNLLDIFMAPSEDMYVFLAPQIKSPYRY